MFKVTEQEQWTWPFLFWMKISLHWPLPFLDPLLEPLTSSDQSGKARAMTVLSHMEGRPDATQQESKTDVRIGQDCSWAYGNLSTRNPAVFLFHSIVSFGRQRMRDNAFPGKKAPGRLMKQALLREFKWTKGTDSCFLCNTVSAQWEMILY